ncbi:MAG: ATP-binding cassette domain-containing protein [Gammaproteobacteria bacterium]|uniref:ABC transporter ATP-binding protein n=1 Tax=Pseudomaricurvus alcaniphilus TaxID=1166482 RepID=UPI001409CC42|nr:ATP-binding cassette domain-containing protein [Pseudomaricurvus alcaniphilus]MBR9910795.1 ATP-binding cassette domain-containing protein [Gammaproteobacteria bacterium]NHN37327.1 ATP-binding cassette domain-containing protein [Pseudomaricurvus alcaniphilus]
MNTPLLDINNVTVYREQNRVFENLNLRIEQDENVAILGPNGAGKSTLLKLLTRELYPLDRPDSWVKIYGNKTVNVQELRSKIGWVSYDFQTQYLPITTGFEVVLSGLLGTIGNLYQYPVSDLQRQLVHDTMKSLGLLQIKDRMFHHLSSGQQRRLILARAMIHQPLAVILDEPTSSLDLQGAFQVLQDMRELIRGGSSVILATHHIHEIIPEIQRVIFIRDGKIIADGDKRELLTTDNINHLYHTKVKLVEHDGYYQTLPA